MLKRKIKVMAAMLSIVILVACIGDTFSKYVAQNSTKLDIDIEMPYNSDLHGRTMLSPSDLYNGITYTVETTDAQGNPTTKEVTCRVLIDTNHVGISLSSNGSYLKVTTHAEVSGELAGYCFDPFIILNFQSDFEAHDMAGYKYTNNTTDYYGLPTQYVRYALIPYYVPYVDPNTLGTYTYTDPETGTTYGPKPYSSYNYDHLRVYTATTTNRSAGGFGGNRYYVGSRTSEEPCKGAWVFALVDLKSTNLKGTEGGSNGIPNWEGNIYELRLDIGQIGSFDAWHQNYDCPDGMTMYIGEIRFFSSLYAAERAVQNLNYNSAYSNDPTTGDAKKDPSDPNIVSYNTEIMVYRKNGVYTTISYEDHVNEQLGVS